MAPSKQRKIVKAPAEEENIYTVEKIIDYRESAGNPPQWRIRWKNYTAADDTWEPEENIIADDKALQSEMTRLQKVFRAAAKASAKAAATKASPRRSSVKAESTPRRVSVKPRRSSTALEVVKPPVVEKEDGGKLRQKRPAPPASFIEASGRTRVAHIRRYPDRDDDFQCVLTDADGETRILPVSEARRKHYNELIDYLLKRVKFLEAAS